MTEQSKAETRGRALAALFEQAGFKTEVIVEREDATLFSSGEVMLPAKVIVHVRANGPNPWDDRYGFTFLTWLPAPGHRSSTSYIGGHLYRMTGNCRSQKLTFKQLRSRLGSELASARYSASQEA
jgi:hypothetical protein